MTSTERLRWVINWLNLTTIAGVAVARLGRTRPHPAAAGLYVAPRYRIAFPPAGAFTLGNVIITRHDADYVCGDPALWRHETRHTTQYAWLGPLFWPAYALGAAYSWVVSGHPGSHNPFEVAAGLADGGYPRRPLRRWLPGRAAARR